MLISSKTPSSSGKLEKMQNHLSLVDGDSCFEDLTLDLETERDQLFSIEARIGRIVGCRVNYCRDQIEQTYDQNLILKDMHSIRANVSLIIRIQELRGDIGT